MTEIYKRQLDQLDEHEAKRQEAEKPRKGNKPGRKPLDTEPKNKRTAQNRAAQRAFRERKERKMQELEEKIDALEDAKRSATTESEFLRLQVQMLTRELAKHRGTTDLSDLQLPALPEVDSSTDLSSQFSRGSESTLKSLSDIVDGDNIKKQFSFEFPWSRKGSLPSSSSVPSSSSAKSPGSLRNSSNNVPTLTSDTSSADSSPFDLYNDDRTDLPHFKKDEAAKVPLQQFDFSEHFDEGVTDFCADMGTACGTKEHPVPKYKSTVSTPVDSPLTFGEQQKKVREDPLSFLNESSMDFNFDTFDPMVAFAGEQHFPTIFNPDEDPLSGLVSEESAYDPFGMFRESKLVERRNSRVPKESENVALTIPAPVVERKEGEEENDTDVVPSNDDRFMKCTDVWDRITSHPKYADIDIDGLCSELRSKAKCSDKGVVIDYLEVNKVIHDNLIKK